jgi:hypothetical protein
MKYSRESLVEAENHAFIHQGQILFLHFCQQKKRFNSETLNEFSKLPLNNVFLFE